MIPDSELNEILEQWNGTEMVYPREVPLAAQVEETTAKSPDAVAVIFEGRQLSYRELNDPANQLARELQKRGAGPDQLVGIYLERSLELMVSLLAVAKAGAAYLPMDPDLPPARLAHMIEDSGVRVIATTGDLVSELPMFQGRHRSGG